MLLLLPNVSCRKELPEVKKPKAEKVEKAEVKREVTGLEEAKAIYEEEYKYDPKGRRDPFLSLVAMTKQKPIKKKGASPFESYDIDEIKLLAIAWDADKHYALIMLPNGKAYTITEGMTLGLQGGKVTKITKNSIVVREYIKDYKGDLKPRDSTLKLHKGEEE
jgi:type IV pilus assembly protein PilP